MVKTKTMPHHTDAKGNLPALAAPNRGPEWDTMAKTFVQKFKIPMKPNRSDELDYRSKSKLSNIFFSFYSTVQYS